MTLPPDICENGFEATARDSAVPSGITVSMRGEADMRAKPHLRGFFATVHATAVERRSDVRVDIRALSFMNSSCLQEFVVWMAALAAIPVDSGYKIVFLSDANQYWQRRSLPPLLTLAPGRVLVES